MFTAIKKMKLSNKLLWGGALLIVLLMLGITLALRSYLLA